MSSALSPTPRTVAQADQFDGPLVVPLEHVLALSDPRVGDPWGVGDIHEHDVRSRMSAGDRCGCEATRTGDQPPCRDCELDRISAFVETGLDPDDAHPISIDVGFGEYLPAWPIQDGNHRLLAAAVRHDPCVVVHVTGDWDRALAVLVDGVPLADVLHDELDTVA